MPIRRSWPMPSATLTTSAPVASHTLAISLMNEIRVISAAFAASLIISAEATSDRTTGAVDAPVERLDRVAVGLVEGPDDDPVGLHEVPDRCALGGELRVGDVADVTEPALVEAVPDLLTGPDGHGRLHRDDDAVVDRRQLVDHRPDGGEIGVARVRRRRADRDVHELGAVDRLGHVQRERQPFPVAREQLVEARLEDRHLAAAKALDPLGDHVPHGDAVPELREAGARDEPDVPCAEDGDALSLVGHVGPQDSRCCRYDFATVASGRRPFAIAIIVSFESRSSSVLTTQYVAPSVLSTTMCRCGPL